MTLLTKEQLEKLKQTGKKAPWVNETCIGCSACIAIAPEVFDLNEEGKSVVIAAEDYDEQTVNDAISACPVDAIYWEK